MHGGEGARRRAAAGAARRARFTVSPGVERVSIAAGVSLVFTGVQLALVALIVGGALALPVRLLQTALFALAPWVLAIAAALVAVTGGVHAYITRSRISVLLLDQVLAGVHAVGANVALAGMVLSCWYGFPTAHRTGVGYRHAQCWTAVVAGCSVAAGWAHFRWFDRTVAKPKTDEPRGNGTAPREAVAGASKGPGDASGAGAAASALSDSDDATSAPPAPPASPRRMPLLDGWMAVAHVVAPLVLYALVAAALCRWFTAYADGPTPEFWIVAGDMTVSDWSGLLRRVSVSSKLSSSSDRLGVGAV